MSRFIDADALMARLGIASECNECEYCVSGWGCSKDANFVEACEAIVSEPTIKTKQIKYYDEDENVWKTGSVIVDE